jgi:hypothetical protein
VLARGVLGPVQIGERPLDPPAAVLAVGVEDIDVPGETLCSARDRPRPVVAARRFERGGVAA